MPLTERSDEEALKTKASLLRQQRILRVIMRSVMFTQFDHQDVPFSTAQAYAEKLSGEEICTNIEALNLEIGSIRPTHDGPYDMYVRMYLGDDAETRNPRVMERDAQYLQRKVEYEMVQDQTR